MRLTAAALLLTLIPSAHPWSKQDLTEEIKDYRGELREEFVELKQKEKNLIRVIKVWKSQKLKKLKEDKDQNLRLLRQEFAIKVESLNAVQKFKTKQHRKLVERTFLRSIELKEEKFLRKKEIYDQYFSDAAEVEKQYMDKYHNIIKDIQKKRVSELNSNKPDFFPRLTEVQRNNWLHNQYCKEQKFYRKEQAKLDHKNYLFDLTVPIRKKREEAEVRYKIAREEMKFYQETYESIVELSKHIKEGTPLIGKYKKKYHRSKRDFYKIESELGRLNQTIKEIASNLKVEKGRKKINCDPTKPIASIRIVE